MMLREPANLWRPSLAKRFSQVTVFGLLAVLAGALYVGIRSLL